MRLKFVAAISFSFLLVLLFSTCSKETETLICRPLNLKLDSGDSVVFDVNDAGHLTSVIQYHVSGFEPDRFEFEYNTDGKMSKVNEYNVLHAPANVIYRTHTFEYNGDLVAKVTTTDMTSSSVAVTTYTHNDGGQLIKLDNDVFGSIRYEYNDQGNVSKVYYFLKGTAEEFLARDVKENDNRFLFYEHIADLKQFYVYLKWYIPGRNNILSSIVKATLSNGQVVGTATPELVNYGVAYNNDGYITGWKPNLVPFYSDSWFINVSYSCDY